MHDVSGSSICWCQWVPITIQVSEFHYQDNSGLPSQGFAHSTNQQIYLRRQNLKEKMKLRTTHGVPIKS